MERDERENEVMEQEANVPADGAAEASTPEASDADRDTWFNNMRNKYPGKSDNELYRLSTEGYNTEHDYAKGMRSQMERLQEAINSNPMISAFIAEIFERGADNRPELAFRHLDDTLKAYMNGDIDEDGYIAERERQDNERKETERVESEKQAAIEAQTQEIINYCEENGIDEATFYEELKDFFDKFGKHNLGKKEIGMLYNMVHHDENVADAREAGRVAGRNESIKAEMDRERHTDGLPRVNNGSAPAETPEAVDALDEMVERRRRRRE